jgi:hypothetical protein
LLTANGPGQEHIVARIYWGRYPCAQYHPVPPDREKQTTIVSDTIQPVRESIRASPLPESATACRKKSRPVWLAIRWRDEIVALNSTLLHELYFASLGGDGRVLPDSLASGSRRSRKRRTRHRDWANNNNIIDPEFLLRMYCTRTRPPVPQVPFANRNREDR